MNLSDLRGILSYIARFRDKIFVLNIDSEILASDNFHNLLLDISVLRSLNIKIVLVHGEEEQCLAFANTLRKKGRDVMVPKAGESLNLNT